MALAIDAVSFLVSALFLGLIRRAEVPPEAVRAPTLSQIREGLGLVLRHVWLRSIAACTGTFNFFTSALFALFVLFATEELGVTPAGLGVIFALGSAGALLGALLAGRLAERLGVGPVIIGSSLVSGLGLLLVPLAAPGTAFPLLAVSQFVVSLGTPIYNINQVSLRQAIVPDRLQGRLNATMRFLVWGTMPLGALAGGGLGEALGLRPAIALSAVGAAMAFLWVQLSPVRGVMRIPEGEEAQAPQR